MKVQLIKIGKTKVIKLPKIILDQHCEKDEVEIEVQTNKLIIRVDDNPRAEWNKSFKKANSDKVDSMIDGDGYNLSSWDEYEWKW
ncbi:MAG: AbrB/MazE/SpoVT family DNA-binding domain-containing protein [Ignavibacteria bacterium]